MKLPTKYIAIDIETTDLDPTLGDVIQIGAVILKEDLSTGHEFATYLEPISKHRNPQAMAVNQITEDMLQMAPNANQALEDFEKFCEKASGTRPHLAAWGTSFDVVFLQSFYKKIGRKWPFSHRGLDLKSVAVWEAAKAGKATHAGGVEAFMEMYDLKFVGIAHDALDDIRNTIRLIQAL